MGRVTLQTVADAVGVSRMTVSNAFSRPDQLSPALRERVLATATELGYSGPDPAARALARGSAGAVGVVLTESLSEAFLDPVAAAFFGAVAEELAPTGLAVSLIPAEHDRRAIGRARPRDRRRPHLRVRRRRRCRHVAAAPQPPDRLGGSRARTDGHLDRSG